MERVVSLPRGQLYVTPCERLRGGYRLLGQPTERATTQAPANGLRTSPWDHANGYTTTFTTQLQLVVKAEGHQTELKTVRPLVSRVLL